MSRNIASVTCEFCKEPVELTEEPRPITANDCGATYYPAHAGMLVANAQCGLCLAKYLAWVGAGTNPRMTPWWGNAGDETKFFDLSFRSTFNDEPGPDDLPKYRIEKVRVGLWKVDAKAQKA